MSRIDEALRRARGDNDEQAESYDSAWGFTEDDQVTRAPGGTGPAPPLPVHVPARVLAAPATTEAPIDRPGGIPGGDSTLLDDRIAGNEKLVGGSLPGVMVEEYRKLAASLHQAQLDRGIKVLLVASAVPGEGKTLTAANLALTLSLSYARRTLLIDADLRKPSLHEVFRLPVASGLSEGLSSEQPVRVSAVQLSPGLAVLPAGRPAANPVPLLTSDRMQQLVDDARQYFDWVVIDTPPVGILTDANLLTQVADAALLVVNAGRTQHALVEKAVEALGRPKIFGVVMNRIEQTPGLSGSNYTGYYRDYLPAER